MSSQCLLALPFEILFRIVSNLDVKDYGNLRRTCKPMSNALFENFAREFLSSKRFMRSPESLQALIDISNSRLGPYLKTVVIGTELLLRHTYGATVSDAVENKFGLAYVDQTSFLAMGRDRDMLTEGLQKLPNLDSVVVSDIDHGRSRGCIYQRDSTPIQAGYGMKTLFQELALDLRMLQHPQSRDPDHNQDTVCFQSVLFALAKAGVKPKRLKTFFWPGLDSDAFNIPTYMESLVLPVLANLEELHIDVSLEWDCERMVAADATGRALHKTHSYHLRRFIAASTNLRCLQLNRLNGHDLTYWLAEAPPSTPYTGPPQYQPPPPASFEHLRELNFSLTQIDVLKLIAIIKKTSPTLKKLALHGVTLVNKVIRSPTPSASDNDPDQSEVNVWALFCKKLVPICENLIEIEFQGLSLHSVGSRMRKVAFESNGDASPSFSYAGSEMKHEIMALVDSVKFEDHSNPWEESESDDDDDDMSETELMHQMMEEDSEMDLHGYEEDFDDDEEDFGGDILIINPE